MGMLGSTMVRYFSLNTSDLANNFSEDKKKKKKEKKMKTKSKDYF